MEIKITDRSPEFKAAMGEAILRALETCGLMAEGYAKRLAPVGTPESTGVPGYIGGTLRNSITHAISGQKTAISEYADNKGNKKGTYDGEAPKDKVDSVYIGTNVEYAAYVELGTSRMKAKPYLKPAVANHASQYRKIIETELKSG